MNYIVIFLLLLVCFHAVNNFIIISVLSKPYFTLAAASYFEQSILFFRNLTEFTATLNIGKLYTAYLHVGSRYRPPLYMMTPSILYSVFGISSMVAVMANIIYFLILVFSTYSIGKIICNRKTGLLAAFLVSMFPATFAISRFIMVDFALMAIVAFSCYLFFMTDGFRNSGYSLLFGTSIALGLLTKWSYLIFIIVPLCYSVPGILGEDSLRIKKIKNFIFSVLLGISIATSWYLPNWPVVFKRLPEVMFNIHTQPSAIFYYKGLLNSQLLLPLTIIFLISLVSSLRKKKYLLPLLILVPVFIFSSNSNKAERFILPVFPFIAVMIAWWVFQVPKKRIAVSALILYSVIQYFFICYISVYLPESKFNFVKDWRTVVPRGGGILTAYPTGSWEKPSREIIQIINGHSEKKLKNNKIYLMPLCRIDQILGPIMYLSAIDKVPINIFGPVVMDLDVDFTKIAGNRVVFFDSFILQADFVITKSYPPQYSKVYTGNIDLHQELQEAFDRHKDKFNLCNTFILPDNSTLYVYKKKLKA